MKEGTDRREFSWEVLLEEFTQNVQLLEPSKVRSSIEDLQKSLLVKGVDLTTPCSALTARQVTAINEILYPSEVQLRESEEKGALELIPADYMFFRENENYNEEVVNAGFLFCWLLGSNVNVKYVDLRRTLLLSRLPLVLKLGLGSSASLRSIRVGLWTDNSKAHGIFLAEGLHRSATALEIYDNEGLELTDNAAILTADVFRRCKDTLREVSLRNGPVQTTSKTAVQLLIEALVGSPALTTLCITGHALSKQGGLAVTKVIESSSKLIDLKLDCIGAKATVVINKAMAANTPPRHSDQEMNDETSASSADGQLESEQMEMWSHDPTGLQKLAQALRDGLEIKSLSLDWEYAGSSFYFGQVFDALSSNPHVTDLHIMLASYFDIYAARLLSRAFERTRTLKRVSFCYEFEDPDIFMTLLVGLARNRSIYSADFGCMFLYKPIPEILGVLMRVNNTLQYLRINDRSLRGQHMKPILDGLSVNYTLTDVHLGQLEYPGDELFRVGEFVRRNRRLLNAAVEFVSGSTIDDESREAFQKLGSSASLLEKVAKVEKVSLSEAEELVRAAGERVKLSAMEQD